MIKTLGRFLPPLTHCSCRGINVKIQHLVLVSAFFKTELFKWKDCIILTKDVRPEEEKKKKKTLDLSFI